MEKRTRRLLFYLAVAIFLLLGYVLVVFALGYKYDFVRGEFLKTGSFQLKTNVPADVYVNDEFAGQTSFLNNNFTASRLLARTYGVRVQSQGYQTWRKDVDVSAGALIEYPSAILLPQSFDEETVASGSFDKKLLTPKVKPKEDLVSPDNQKSLIFNDQEIWVKWLRDSSVQPYKKTGDLELVTRFSQTVKDVQWYRDSNHVIADVGGILKFLEIDTRGGINIFEVTTVEGRFYYDPSTNSVFKMNGESIGQVRLE